MIIPLIPYGHRMITGADLKALSQFLSESKVTSVVIPLVLYPVYLVLFRIITSVRSHKKKIRFVIISTSVAFVLITAALSVMGILRTRSLNQKQITQPEISLSPLGNELIELSVNDKNVFDDIVRTVDISLKQKCLICDILITTEGVNPVLYSDNDFINPSANTARFRIPDNPPQEMTFRYGAAKTPCRITVSAVIEDEADENYHFISRSLELEEN